MSTDSMINLRNWNFGETQRVERKKERKKEGTHKRKREKVKQKVKVKQSRYRPGVAQRVPGS